MARKHASACREAGLLQHVRSLILELGKGFAFVGSRYPLEVGGQDFYLDLLFYHLRLRCFVVLELKVEGFKLKFAGKMNFYLAAIDDSASAAHRQPLRWRVILCKDRSEVIVEYSLREQRQSRMGVARYQLSAALPEQLKDDSALPTAEDLAAAVAERSRSCEVPPAAGEPTRLHRTKLGRVGQRPAAYRALNTGARGLTRRRSIYPGPRACRTCFSLIESQLPAEDIELCGSDAVLAEGR